MNVDFLKKENTGKLILIFAGWSTTPEFYSHISHDGFDVAVAYGYDDLDFPVRILEGYSTVCLFAWSLGVFVASASVPFDKIAMAVAVNGTESPVDDSFGIPGNIYDGTIESLNDRNLMKFRRRMSGKSYDRIKNSFTFFDIPELQRQLRFIKTTSSGFEGKGKWNKVFISSEDAIFPPENQMAFWKSKFPETSISVIEKPHYIDLAGIIESAIPRHNKIGKRFKNALTSYSSEAVAQKEIACRLLDMIPQGNYYSVLEIGPGSGIFTKLFADRFKPREMTFSDLYELPCFNLSPEEIYIVCDAENWTEMEAECNPEGYDAVVSASAIQWFVNPEKFIANASKLIRNGGILACSTFLPGNLEELSVVNPLGLIYRSKEEIENALRTNFDDFITFEDKIELDFESPRDVIHHLHATGVGGSSGSGATVRELLSRLPSRLTYRPLYFVARKKSNKK